MGQKSALYNSTTGAIIGYYDSVDSPLPQTLPSGSDSLDITDQEWQSALSSPYQPVTVANGVLTIPSGPTLAQAKASQIALLKNGYRSAINAPVTFTNAAGVTSTYPSGDTILINGMRAKDLLAEVLSAGEAAWTLGKWIDANDVAQTFTFADLQGLAAAMEAAVTTSYETLVSKIAQVNAATTVAEVQSITF